MAEAGFWGPLLNEWWLRHQNNLYNNRGPPHHRRNDCTPGGEGGQLGGPIWTIKPPDVWISNKIIVYLLKLRGTQPTFLIYGSLRQLSIYSKHFYYWLEDNGRLSESKGRRSYILKLVIKSLSQLNKCWSTLPDMAFVTEVIGSSVGLLNLS